MKKKLLLIAVLCVLVLGISGCGEKKGEPIEDNMGESTSSVEKSENSVVSEAVVEEEGPKDNTDIESHIKSITSSKRGDFPYFWQNICSNCRNLERELDKIENTETFEFNPVDESQIPEKLKEVFDFLEFTKADISSIYEEFNIKIVGEKVTFFADGFPIYPTNYGYATILEFVNS